MSYPNDDEPRWAQGRTHKMHPDTVQMLAGPPKVAVTPLAGINSATHYARCAEMAEMMLVMVPYDSPERPSIDLITAWFAYLAGSTNERPS